MKTNKNLHCVRLNDTKAFELPRAIFTEVIPDFQALAAGGGGKYPCEFGQYEFKLQTNNGYAAIGLKVNGQAVAFAGLAWNPYDAEHWFAEIQQVHAEMLRARRAPAFELKADRPKQIPWLAISLAPSFLAAASAEAVEGALSGLGAAAFGVLAHYENIAVSN